MSEAVTKRLGNQLLLLNPKIASSDSSILAWLAPSLEDVAIQGPIRASFDMHLTRMFEDGALSVERCRLTASIIAHYPGKRRYTTGKVQNSHI